MVCVKYLSNYNSEINKFTYNQYNEDLKGIILYSALNSVPSIIFPSLQILSRS
jgi:hypothetical protein